MKHPGLVLINLKNNSARICDKSLSSKAATFYYDNRYGAYEDCSNPCKKMTVTTINKFKIKRNDTLAVEFFFPREIEFSKEIFVKTFISMGENHII